MDETVTRQTPLILVVDDDKDARRLMCFAMELAGYETEEAVNGRQALSAYERLLPDAVLLDIMMPGIDGFTVCARMRALRDDRTPVVMYTALKDPQSFERAFAVGADAYVTKEAGLDVLCDRVEALLDDRREGASERRAEQVPSESSMG